MNPESMDSRHRALVALTVAAEAFLVATIEALEAKSPGRGEQDRALLNAGAAHMCISIQCGSGQVRAALAMVAPEFGETLAEPEMTLQGSLASIFGDPAKVKLINLGGMN